MAHETITKSRRFYCVNLYPDFCKTPVGNAVVVVPYKIKGEFIEAVAVSPNIKAQGEPVFLHARSFIPTVTGDERGTLGGIKSGTFGQKVESYEYSLTKGANGTQTIQESRMVWMNNRNTFGRVMERGVQPAKPRVTILGFEVPQAVQEKAQAYLDDVSAPLHETMEKTVDAGGKVLLASGTVAVAGVAVGATVIGAPVAVGMETAAVAGATVGTVVSGVGAAGETLTAGADVVARALTGQSPDVLLAAKDAVVNLAEDVVLKKAAAPFDYLKKLFNRKPVPGHTPAPPPRTPPPATGGNGPNGQGGGKNSQNQDKPADKPSSCCPKNGGPGAISVMTPKPVHIGTGEEILAHTDFVLQGSALLAWTRTYRSGSGAEDWGVLGARWSTPYTASLSVCGQGVVYHDASGRALRLPALAAGQEHDQRSEGFILRCEGERGFSLEWRDGTVDSFAPAPDGFLAHGYDGVNAMLAPRALVRTRRYCLARSTRRDGGGYDVERCHDAAPGQVLLRVRSSDGLTIEALRAPLLACEQGASGTPLAPRIGRVEQVFPDGARSCHASYRYEAAPHALGPLPARCLLVAQSDRLEQSRTYDYQHQLLTGYSNYQGFVHHLEWISLDALRARWGGSALSQAELRERHPISDDNSARARVVREAGADGKGETLLEYVDSATTRVTDPCGGVLEFTFNSQWLATSIKRIHPDGSTRSFGRREWDRDGMLLADIDGEGNDARYTYDAAGNLTSITDPRRHVTRFVYDGANQPVAVTDALGHTWERRYDGAGRIVEQRDALGHRTGYAYDAQGRLARVVDAHGGARQLRYDAAGRLAAYTDCSGFSTEYGYDAHNRLASIRDAAGQQGQRSYDALGRLALLTHADGSVERFSYDSDDNLLSHTDARGRVTRYVYNGHNLPVERIDAKGQRLRYGYDEALRMVELVNANDERYLFSYDSDGRLLGETGFDGKHTAYGYDRAGYLISSDSAGKRTDYTRDALGLLLVKTSADGCVRYAYDALGRLTAIAAGAVRQRFAYDPLGQIIDERSAYALDGPGLAQEADGDAAFALSHAYDALGNRVQTTLPDGRRIDTQRYGSGHWHGTLWQGRTLVDLERDRLHRETGRQLGSAGAGLSEQRVYDPQSRLAGFTLRHGQQLLRRRDYHYDSTGNLLKIDDAQRGATEYRYDPLDQLLSAVHRDASETFAFDPAGNLLDAAPAAGADADQQGGPAALPKVTHNLLRHYMGCRYRYDEQGNASARHTGADELALAYDGENRLASATLSRSGLHHVTRYLYDAFGRRIAKLHHSERDDAVQVGPTRQVLFVWDGDLLVQEIHAGQTISYVYEPDSFVPLAQIVSGHGGAAHAPRDTHLRHVEDWELPPAAGDAAAHLRDWRAHADDAREQDYLARRRRCIDQAASAPALERIYYYQCDHLGTPHELLDEQGEAVWSVSYRAWGRIARAHVHKLAQPLRFQGQYADEESGLHYNRHRYYDPDSGRFLSQDPLGLDGGINLYQYAPNPTGFVDPLGLRPEKCKNKGGLNWAAITGKDGETRQEHVRSGHGVLNANKPTQTLFYKDPVREINAAWRKRMKSNPCPDSSDAAADIYEIDMHRPVGYDRDTGAITSKVKIFVMRNTNKIITGYPAI
ncbi:RHS repeat-associated core domain-containing protein [Massilia scottii]|uniref:RHS repeat-associated core domain-containing protein n=1 Tax=Massilia scottii TaxID=3057166 RepID=UPI002796B47C|nr:RHS repeat-associated core domain-containing protein [Massilia sp. CCM 9029]MDQ1829738.1 RHS repeat-associated core domain-containing protein [Massilia sp. CCM 9029]